VNANIACYPFAERVLRAPLLYVAIQKGQFNTVSFLLEKGADPNQPDGRGETPLMWAAQPEILELLLKKGADPNKHGLGYRNTPLIEAAAYGTTQTVSLLLAAGAAVNATNLNGATAFHRARTPEIAQMLITAGADPNLRDTQGETPVDIWASRGYTNVLTALSNETFRTTSRIRR
jgi:ankyrin repeat protein